MANNGSIQFLRGTSARKQAVGAQTTLLAGQPFFETDTNKLYIGNGVKNLLNTSAVNGSGYDTVITNQAEFRAWYTQLDAGTYTGASVLILSGTYTRSDGKSLHLPETLKQLHGTGTVKIDITKFVYNRDTNKGGIWYTTVPTAKEYSIENISLSCTGTTDTAGFSSCTNLTNCTGTGSSTGGGSYGFTSCTNLTNCTGTGITGFSSCTNLTNCTGTGTAGYGSGFTSCKICSNCRRDPSKSSTTATWGGTNANISKDTCPEYTS